MVGNVSYIKLRQVVYTSDNYLLQLTRMMAIFMFRFCMNPYHADLTQVNVVCVTVCTAHMVHINRFV